MITVVLDGYNVIHALPALAQELDRSLQAAREALVRLCRQYRARRGDVGQLYVVFDGADVEGSGPREDQQGVTVLFTRRGEEADERIMRLIREGGRGRFAVVSDDAQVANNARAHGARALSVREFAGQMQPARAPGATRPAAPEKAPLPSQEAVRITEEYRKHLKGKRLIAVLLLVAARPAAADEVRLKNGNVIEGTLRSQDDRQVVMEIPGAGELTVDRAEVAAVTVSAPAPEAPAVPVPQAPSMSVPEASVATPSPAAPQVEQLLRKALEAIARRNYGEALTLAQQAVEADPTSSMGHAGLGNIYAALHEYDKAIAALETALRLNPKDPGALFGLGACYLDLQQHEKAVPYLERAVKLQPGEAKLTEALAVAYVRRGIIAGRKGQAAKAKMALEAAIALFRRSGNTARVAELTEMIKQLLSKPAPQSPP